MTNPLSPPDFVEHLKTISWYKQQVWPHFEPIIQSASSDDLQTAIGPAQTLHLASSLIAILPIVCFSDLRTSWMQEFGPPCMDSTVRKLHFSWDGRSSSSV